MPASSSEPDRSRIRAALFVDFDNVYIGLQTLDAGAAERFATDPGRWTEAIADGDGQGSLRRFLIRNCYLNPTIFSKYRAYWTRAGFRVIDCPSLTQQGKSSTGINLVLDAVDVLSGPGSVEEFFIASADADFTSLVQRFRAADRLTTVIVAGAVASAYREMADSVVESDDFVAILNGIASNPAMTEVGAGRQKNESAAAPENSDAGQAPALTAGVARSAAADAVLDHIRMAPGPVKGAVLAHRARTAEPSISGDWGGYGSFGAWLGQFVGSIGYSSTPPPGWAWDARRFSVDNLPTEIDVRPEIEEQVTRVTDVPVLSTAQFRQIFSSLESRLSKSTFNRNETSKQVRDDCAAAVVPVSRSAVNFVIQGLLYAGVSLNAGTTGKDLAAGWTKNVEALCRGARMEFDDSEEVRLRTWVSGGFVN